VKIQRSHEKQQETMKLYNKAGVNPMAGCIPALIQMPFDGFVSVFPSAFELRHKSFLWADDLSSFDEIVKLPFTFPFMEIISVCFLFLQR
jgi:YidC/Oxa1 family membrane protein insertase